MGLFSKPEVVIAKESSNAKEYLRQLEELAEKAAGENAKKIAKEIAVVKAGIIGEDNILFELKNSGMDMVVLHDLYIESVSGASAQIDFLVLTPKINHRQQRARVRQAAVLKGLRHQFFVLGERDRRADRRGFQCKNFHTVTSPIVMRRSLSASP